MLRSHPFHPLRQLSSDTQTEVRGRFSRREQSDEGADCVERRQTTLWAPANGDSPRWFHYKPNPSWVITSQDHHMTLVNI